MAASACQRYAVMGVSNKDGRWSVGMASPALPSAIIFSARSTLFLYSSGVMKSAILSLSDAGPWRMNPSTGSSLCLVYSTES